MESTTCNGIGKGSWPMCRHDTRIASLTALCIVLAAVCIGLVFSVKVLSDRIVQAEQHVILEAKALEKVDVYNKKVLEYNKEVSEDSFKKKQIKAF